MLSAAVVAFALSTATAASDRPIAAPLYADTGICPLAVMDPGEVDRLVACPGWETRPCRERDARGKLRRSSTIKREFLTRYGYPRGRPGFVLDHIFALAGCGDGFTVGCDVPWNIQFQSKADGKAKDKWERVYCAPDDADEEAAE